MTKTVIVTRPGEAGQRLVECLEGEQFKTLFHPAVTLDGPENPEQVKKELAELENYQMVIFVSIPSVDWTFKLAEIKHWPEQVEVASVGESTAKKLMSLGVPDVVTPEHQMNARALLRTDALEALGLGDQVLLLTAEGGNTRIEDTLGEQNVIVDRVHVYQRHPITKLEPAFVELLKNEQELTIIVTSEALLDALIDACPEEIKSLLLNQAFVVSSRALVLAANKRGIENVIQAAGPTPRQLIKELQPEE
ncbi:MAG: uroporphyrinogen-III synthase [bacterium]